MRLGLSTYCYTWAFGVPGKIPSKPMTAIDLVDKAVEYNLSCIQIADNYPLHELETPELVTLREYSLEKGVSIEVGARCLTLDRATRYIQIASFFQSPILRFVIDLTRF